MWTAHPKASKENPLAYFRWIFSDKMFQYNKVAFFSQYEDNIDFIFDENTVSFTMIVADENGNSKEVVRRFDFAVELQKGFSVEAKITKLAIDNAIDEIVFNDRNLSDYLNLQMDILDDLFIASREVQEQYLFIAEILNEIKNHLEIQKKKSVKTESNSPKIINDTFSFKGKPILLKKLKEYLEDDVKFINETEDFEAIFTGKPFNSKVNWLSYKNYLHYFIDKLSENKFVDFDEDRKWVITSKTFTLRNENIDPEDIKSNNKEPSEKKKKLIDKAIEIIS